MPEILVISNLPDAEKARQIGTHLVENQLAACVNVLPRIESIYRWEGALENAQEFPIWIKTTADKYSAVEQAIREQHPYEVPEIIAVEIREGFDPYLEWVRNCVS